MESQLHVYYDEEADFLEITMGKFSNSYCRDIEEGVFERIDEDTGEVVGIGILSFKERPGKIKEIDVKLPWKLALMPA